MMNDPAPSPIAKLCREGRTWTTILGVLPLLFVVSTLVLDYVFKHHHINKSQNALGVLLLLIVWLGASWYCANTLQSTLHRIEGTDEISRRMRAENPEEWIDPLSL